MKKVLIVDDEKPVCDMLNKFLIKKGYKTLIALSGKEAIKKVKEEKPHMILLDIRMPEMNGIEALKKIRKIDKKAGIIMITAVQDDETGKECLELGAYDYITKPLSLDYLEQALAMKLLDFPER